MKPDVIVAYPLRPHQMAMLEETNTLHRLDLVKGEERDALLRKAGPISSATSSS